MWILPQHERVKSPNFSPGRQGQAADVLVMHYAVDGDDTPDGSAEDLNFVQREPSHDCMDVARLFSRKSRQASSHLVVGRDGSKAQCVQLCDTAWHAGGGALPRAGAGPLESPRRGEMNRRSVGIELCNAGWAVDKLKIPAEHRELAAHPATPRRKREWEKYRPAQIETLEYCVALLRSTCPTLKYVCGHEDVVNSHTRGRIGGKVDPGPLFPWEAIPWEELGFTRLVYDFKKRAWVQL